ncbi:MAG: helix-turn-helix domain-containing protein [Lachnospiraceae bacterium]|nr:helix-turn-helix domain-containing protein [Lachnospiraceae bacterium]
MSTKNKKPSILPENSDRGQLFNGERYLTIAEVAEILPIGRDATYNLFKLKGFPSIQLGKRWIVSETSLKKWLKEQEGSKICLNE